MEDALKLLFAAILIVIMPTMAISGSEVGTVEFVDGQYHSSETSAGYTFFYVHGGTKYNNPSCSTNSDGHRWVIDNDWPAAKYQIATLLTAVVAGRSVQVEGTNNCNVWSDTETAQDIFLK